MISVRFPEHLLKELNRLSDENGVTRNALIVRCVEVALAANAKEAKAKK